MEAERELIEAIEVVLDRLTAWHDGARIAGMNGSSEARNTMMNYAHLIDILNGALLVANREV